MPHRAVPRGTDSISVWLRPQCYLTILSLVLRPLFFLLSWQLFLLFIIIPTAPTVQCLLLLLHFSVCNSCFLFQEKRESIRGKLCQPPSHTLIYICTCLLAFYLSLRGNYILPLVQKRILPLCFKCHLLQQLA